MNGLNYKFQGGFNPIIEASKSIFALSMSMKDDNLTMSGNQLLKQLCTLICSFERDAQQKNVGYDLVKAAKYCLCTFVDEKVSNTRFATEGWNQNSLLVTFFGEASDDERFFQILENTIQSEQDNLYLIELIYICLQFGYQGKYRLLSNGEDVLDDLKRQLKYIIYSRKTDGFELLLNEKNEISTVKTLQTKFRIPFWVLCSIVALLLGLTFSFFNLFLEKKFISTNEVVNSLSLRKVVSHKRVNNNSNIERLRPQLSNDINTGLVEVLDLYDRSIISIKSDSVFDSGTGNIKDSYMATLANISQVLESTNGPIVVTSYSDNKEIQNLEFLSSWELSQSRADTIKGVLLRHLKEKDRVRAEGRGSKNPVTYINSEKNGFINRKIQITLFTTNNKSMK